jgi:hypothetical protein
VNDKFTMIRSMSYTPNGLFNHTAAIYQMMTGYTTDKVSPSGQLEPPKPEGFPELRLEHHPAEAADGADAAVCDAAAAAAGEQRGGQRRHGRFPGQSVRSVHAVPGRRRHGHEQDGPHPDRRPAAAAGSVRRPAGAPRPAARVDQRGHAQIEKAVEQYNLDEYYDRALSLIISGRAREAFDFEGTGCTARPYGRNTFGQSCLLARRLVEAGTRVVEVIWPKVANSDNHSWDHHVGLTSG